MTLHLYVETTYNSLEINTIEHISVIANKF